MDVQQVVRVSGLWVIYERSRKTPGLRGTVHELVRRPVERVEALRGVSFTVGGGEIVGYIGPNGAGKTTTLKILAGVLHPASGEVDVLGFRPQARERTFLKQISFVMSGRGFLEEIAWDLSGLDGLNFVRELYGMRLAEYRQVLEELVEHLQLGELLSAPVRQLSHGQRARLELAAALLWQPRCLLLDEPTLGLDIMSQQALRRFIRAYVRSHDAACIVTSHYMRDIEELADRVILLDRGDVIAQGSPSAIIERLSDARRIQVEFECEVAQDELATLGRLVHHAAMKATLEVPHARVKATAKALLDRWPVRDISIEEPSLEEALLHHFAADRRVSC